MHSSFRWESFSEAEFLWFLSHVIPKQYWSLCLIRWSRQGLEKRSGTWPAKRLFEYRFFDCSRVACRRGRSESQKCSRPYNYLIHYPTHVHQLQACHYMNERPDLRGRIEALPLKE